MSSPQNDFPNDGATQKSAAQERSSGSKRSRARKRHIVCQAADLPPGERKIVTINGREIGIFNVHGEYYALLNYCPHRAAPLCRGRVRPLVVSDDVYSLDYEREGEILKCPWHMWEFDIRTGCALFDAKKRVRTYEVRQEGDDLVLYT